MRIYLKNYIRIFIFLCLFSYTVFSQITVNTVIDHKINNINLTNLTDIYLYNTEDQISADTDSIDLGFDLGLNYQNDANIHYQVYKNKYHYFISPFYHLKFNKHICFDLRLNIENIKDSLQYPERKYWSKEYRNHWGGTEVAKMNT